MNINTSSNLYHLTNKADQPRSSVPQTTTKPENNQSDTVSISEKAQHLFKGDESGFTMNNAVHTYSKNPENIAALGVMTVADPDHDINPKGIRQTTRFEAAVMGDYMDTYREITRNPERAIQESQGTYTQFLDKANNAVAELKERDTTNSFTISIGGLGGVKIDYNDSINNASNGVHEQSVKDRESMNQWLENNTGKMKDIAALGRNYSYAKSIHDYGSATGVDRDHLIDTQLKPIEGRDNSFKSSDAEINEYMLKMQRYADNAFGTSPVSYSEIDQWGAPGYPNDGISRPTLLPDMG